MPLFLKHPTVRFCITILGLMITLSASLTLHLDSGFSATFLLISLACLCCVAALLGQFNQQNKTLSYVLKSLANGDNSLGLSPSHPMRAHLEEIKDAIQDTRFALQQHADFLQALLVHIDVAVLVFDEHGKVIEANPSASKLLGKTIKHCDDMAHLAPLIHQCSHRLQTVANWHHGEQQDTLTMQVSCAHIQGKVRKIVTLSSIRDALQNKEQQAYKRLTKVLTHEVANSITPLASLAKSCSQLLPESLTFDDVEDKSDLELALNTLARRTEYLGDFIGQFRTISNLPAPTLSPAQASELMERVFHLYLTTCNDSDVSLELDLAHPQLVMMDSAQVEQVLINLIKNAFEACLHSNTPSALHSIKLVAGNNGQGQFFIEVTDNGPGVAEHVTDMMFVPFFTTKQQGSGIGLSLSRQIMLNHGGDLIYIKREQGACFRCIFG